MLRIHTSGGCDFHLAARAPLNSHACRRRRRCRHRLLRCSYRCRTATISFGKLRTALVATSATIERAKRRGSRAHARALAAHTKVAARDYRRRAGASAARAQVNARLRAAATGRVNRRRRRRPLFARSKAPTFTRALLVYFQISFFFARYHVVDRRLKRIFCLQRAAFFCYLDWRRQLLTLIVFGSARATRICNRRRSRQTAIFFFGTHILRHQTKFLNRMSKYCKNYSIERCAETRRCQTKTFLRAS